MQHAGHAAKLAGDTRPSLGGVYELLRELNAPLQIGDACLSFWCLPVGIQALAPCVVPLPPSVPFNPVAVSSWCRRLGILGVMYMLARFPVVPQAAKLLLYLVEHIVGKQYVQLLVDSTSSGYQPRSQEIQRPQRSGMRRSIPRSASACSPASPGTWTALSNCWESASRTALPCLIFFHTP